MDSINSGSRLNLVDQHHLRATLPDVHDWGVTIVEAGLHVQDYVFFVREDRSMVKVRTAFRSARVHSFRHMDACEKARLRWGEVAITEMVMSRVAKATRVVPFTQSAESVSGADWIWWWVDATAAYGMLVQAKRVTVNRDKWHFDFDYPAGSGGQRSKLMSTAAALDLTPAYALYLGTGDYRSWVPCPDNHRSGRCLSCIKRSVSLIPASLAMEMYTYNATSTYASSVALEDVSMPGAARTFVMPELRTQLIPELDEFLVTRQSGVRAVARTMIDRVLQVRMGQFAEVSTLGETMDSADHDRLGRVFRDVPRDTGHWRHPYFKQVLDPLVQAPPGYVLDFETGGANADDLAADMPDSVAGIVVLRLPQDEDSQI